MDPHCAAGCLSGGPGVGEPCNAAAGGGGGHPGPRNAGSTAGGISTSGGKVSGEGSSTGTMGSENKSSTNIDITGPNDTAGAMYSSPWLFLHIMALSGISSGSHLLVWRD